MKKPGEQKREAKEVALARLELKRVIVTGIFTTIKKGMVCVTVLGAIWMVVKGIVSIGQREAGVVAEMSKVVAEFHLDTLVCAISALAFGGLYARERRMRKELVGRHGDLRHNLEKDDTYNGRSGLDRRGDAPKEE